MVKPPPGPYAAGVLVPQWLLIGISFLVIVARLNLRVRVQRIPLMVSDYLMCCAWLCAVATAAFDIVFARMGVFHPDLDYFMLAYDGPPEDIEFVFKLQFASQFPFDLTFYFAKAALLALYLRMFPAFMLKRRIVLWVVIAYCAAAYVVTLCVELLVCRPIEGNWSLDPNVICTWEDVVRTFILCWTLHFSSDVMIFIVPFMVLSQLRLERSVKIGVLCTFLLGIISIAFSLTRFLTLFDGSLTEAPSLSLVELWCALDCNIAVLIACVPSLRPYFRDSLWRGHMASPTLSGTSDTRSKTDVEPGFGAGNSGHSGGGSNRRALAFPPAAARSPQPAEADLMLTNRSWFLADGASSDGAPPGPRTGGVRPEEPPP